MNLFSTWSSDARFSKAKVHHVLAGWGISLAMVCAICVPVCTLGCGMAAAPQPPSLHLPKTIRDLRAARVGNQVQLQWTTPSETTDKLKIQGMVQLRICRRMKAALCQSVATIFATPGKSAGYTETLPAALATGPLHAMTYEIFAVNRHGKSAGPSNAAGTVAGAAPSPIQNLSASMLERGVMLRWQSTTGQQPGGFIQLQRTLLTPPVNLNSKTPGPLPPVSEPMEETLQVAPETGAAGKFDPGAALDSSVVFGRKYRYVATRVAGLKAAGMQRLQVASSPSAPAIIFTRDIFPPAAPAGLAAVPVSAAINGGKLEVDLSWSANTEPDLAQYVVYRRDVGAQSSTGRSRREQIAPSNSTRRIVTPAFRDMHVEAGRTYAYSVVAVDRAGNKSPPSPEVEVTIPAV